MNFDILASYHMVFLKITLAGAMGGLIGYERETHGQAAGFRTNILVAMGSCLMMLLSVHMEEMFRDLSSTSSVRIDPSRIASYAVASMGFLGAGAIIKGRGTVRGLTTAAGLWLVTGIGLAVGAGYWIPALFTTLASTIILFFMRVLLRPLVKRDLYSVLTVTCACDLTRLREIREILGAGHPSIRIQAVNYYHDLEAGRVTYALRIISKDSMPWAKVTEQLRHLPGIFKLSWEEAEVP